MSGWRNKERMMGRRVREMSMKLRDDCDMSHELYLSQKLCINVPQFTCYEHLEWGKHSISLWIAEQENLCTSRVLPNGKVTCSYHPPGLKISHPFHFYGPKYYSYCHTLSSSIGKVVKSNLKCKFLPIFFLFFLWSQELCLTYYTLFYYPSQIMPFFFLINWGFVVTLCWTRLLVPFFH